MVARLLSNKKRMPYKYRRQKKAAHSTQILTFLLCKLVLFNEWFSKEHTGRFCFCSHCSFMPHVPTIANCAARS